MKILWHSNAPFVPSGYGNQTDIFSRALVKRGHEVFISAYYGHRGARIKTGQISILPGSRDEYGNDVLQAHYDVIQPDVFLTLMDVWVLNPSTTVNLPIAAWTPVDHYPLPPAMKTHLRALRHHIAMSRFGERMMRQAGFDPFYVPHAVETDVYKPMDATERAEARKLWKVDDAKFFAITVAANKGMRKNLDLLLKAWARFVEIHPDSLLYLHTDPRPYAHGHDLEQIVDLYEIPRETVRFADQYRLTMGDYGTERMNALYNAADVFVLPSAGEGFGIPIVEAQAAGCPAIVCDFSAMGELAAHPGWVIPIDDDDLRATAQGAEQALPKADNIRMALEKAWHNKGDKQWREGARAFAMQYDVERVMERHMLPALECIAEINKAERSRYAKAQA